VLVAITGTPGTGKSTAAKLLDGRGYYVVYLDQLAEERKLITGVDQARGAREVDVERLDQGIQVPVKLGFLVSHYAHLMSVDIAIVLRCHPRILAKRLRFRGWSDAKVRENVEAEAIDVITQEAVGRLPLRRGKRCARVAEYRDRLHGRYGLGRCRLLRLGDRDPQHRCAGRPWDPR